MSEGVVKRQGVKAAEGLEAGARWQDRLRRFEKAGVSVSEFCKAESVSMWSFYRWRGKLVGPARGQLGCSARTAKVNPFIELGALEGRGEQGVTGQSGGSMELRIESNGTIVLRLMRS